MNECTYANERMITVPRQRVTNDGLFQHACTLKMHSPQSFFSLNEEEKHFFNLSPIVCHYDIPFLSFFSHCPQPFQDTHGNEKGDISVGLAHKLPEFNVLGKGVVFEHDRFSRRASLFPRK